MNTTLLPSGMSDLLPPEAGRQRRLINQLLDAMELAGYAQVNPPLMEHEETLLAGSGAHTADAIFRVMDPVSHKMLGLRADMTPQIARIAGGVMANAQRPLCLCYAGQNIRVSAEALQTRRQLAQVGLERFGDTSDIAESEIISTTLNALAAAGFKDITLDISLPDSVQTILSTLQKSEKDIILQHIRRKDVAALETSNNTDIATMLRASGTWDSAVSALKAMNNAAINTTLQSMDNLVSSIHTAHPGLTIQLDPLEARGFEYHHYISYSLFLNDVGVEIGRGGRYKTNTGEVATGLTLYTNTLLDYYEKEQ